MLSLFIILSSPTYTKDIKPIFHNRCSECHDSMTGRNWQIYEEAYANRYQIKEEIQLKDMPLGKTMPQSERDLIVEWVNEGAKK